MVSLNVLEYIQVAMDRQSITAFAAATTLPPLLAENDCNCHFVVSLIYSKDSDNLLISIFYFKTPERNSSISDLQLCIVIFCYSGLDI